MEINNHIFLISGGASGLGLATARMILENSGKVILLDIDEYSGQQAAESLGSGSCFIPADVTDENSIEQAIEIGTQKFGGLHGVINCAGVGPAERVLGREGIHSLSGFTKVVQINLIGTFNVLRLAANHMQHNKPEDGGERGVLINTASVAAFDGQIGQAAYSASKGGIVAMTLPIAREFSRFGIRLMTIAPGIFETPMLASLPVEVKASLGKQVPFPSRLGRPEEFASLAKHIIENQMLNGEVIRLDGAIRMTAK